MKKLPIAKRLHNGALYSKIKNFSKKTDAMLLLFLAVLSAGAAAGALSGRYADQELMNSLDLIFLTNFQMRKNAGLWMIFISSFSSGFIFLLAAFLSGLSLWGMVCVLFIPFLKGFGYGLTMGYLYSTYGLTGILYNLLIILPGAFIFSVVISAASKASLKNSVQLLSVFFKKAVSDDPAAHMRKYLISMFWFLMLTLLSAAADTVFSLMFSWIFR